MNGTDEARSAKGWRLLAFALPGAPLLALSVPPIVFLPRYYAEYLEIPAATIGALFLAARVFDLIVNPTIGALQDRTRLAFGRRRTWLVGATPVVMLAVWFAFIAVQPGVSAIVLGLAVLSLYASFASAMIAHLGWAGEIRPEYHGRTRVLSAVQAASSIGQILVMALPALVEMSGLGGFDDGVRLMGWTIIIALPITVAIAVCAVPENAAPASDGEDTSHGFAQSLAALRDNEALRRVLIPDFLLGATQGVAGTLFMFYAVQVHGLGGVASTLLLLYFVAGLVGVPLWLWLGRRMGKHRALQLSCLWWGAALACVPLLPHGSALLVGIGMFIAGLPAVAGTQLLRSMMADVVDEDELRTSKQRSGLFFGLLLTTGKIGLALGPASLILLAPFGFSAARNAANTPEALIALTVLFAGAPAVLNLLTAWSLQNYPLDEERQHQLREEIAKRRASDGGSAA